MIDVVALWVGRIVLGLAALTVVLTVLGMFAVGFRVITKAMKDAWKESRRGK